MRLDLGTASALVTCEHASNRLPARYRRLGLPASRLDEHIAWDRGAAILARHVAQRIGAPLHLGRWSRLLVDLNRSIGHPKLMARSSFGVRSGSPARRSCSTPFRVGSSSAAGRGSSGAGPGTSRRRGHGVSTATRSGASARCRAWRLSSSCGSRAVADSSTDGCCRSRAPRPACGAFFSRCGSRGSSSLGL